MFVVILQQIISGLAMGCIYTLVALGYTFIWNAVGIVNLSQGDFVTIAAFLYAATFANKLQWPFFLAALAVCCIMAVWGIVAERIVYHPLQGAHPRSVMLSTLALGIVLSNLALIIWGPFPFATSGLFGQEGISVGGVFLMKQNLFIIAVALILLYLQRLFFSRATLGKLMRAVAQDREAAVLMGIDSGLAIAFTFAYSSMLAAVAGILIAPVFMVSIDLSAIGLKGFASSVVGGFGNIQGAAVGGLVIGLIEILSASFVSSLYKDAIVFAVLILFLLLRPQGIFGKTGGQSL